MTEQAMASNYFDVIIVGAGLSGIGAACHLREKCPGKTFALLEGRNATGGTWDLFRYPGVRSDSDMYTLGYNFKPWEQGKAIADGASILEYVRATAAENSIDEHIHFGHKVYAAAWSTEDAKWALSTRVQDGSTANFSCNMLLMCSGYYSYNQGYTPEFAGLDDFTGRVLHPQKWPGDLDYANKKVVVIGSGATAMTLVPAMAHGGAARVTMVQRSPTYVVSLPDEDWIANLLRRLLPSKIAYAITRWKNINLQRIFFSRARSMPKKIKGQLLELVRKHLAGLPKDYVDRHFTPTYNPWDERLCLIPNADLFEAIKQDKAGVVTGQIDRFTADGIRMQSGEEIPADIIVTATGLQLVVLGEVELSADGRKLDISSSFTYKGMMYSGIPNMVHTFGYVNASWTLRADLTAEYACRLVQHMDKVNMRQCMPTLTQDEKDMQARVWIDTFTPGYMKRVMHLFPKQGEHMPWVHTQNYAQDKKMLHNTSFEDGALHFTHPATPYPRMLTPTQDARQVSVGS